MAIVVSDRLNFSDGRDGPLMMVDRDGDSKCCCLSPLQGDAKERGAFIQEFWRQVKVYTRDSLFSVDPGIPVLQAVLTNHRFVLSAGPLSLVPPYVENV